MSATEMKTYAIRRKQAWESPAEVEQVAARSKQVADDGTLGTVCIYQATSPEAIRRHAHRVGMPADEIWVVADTVVIRPDPVAEPVAS